MFFDCVRLAPRILIFSISMDADYSFEMKTIEIWAPAFFKHNNSFVSTMKANALAIAPRRCCQPKIFSCFNCTILDTDAHTSRTHSNSAKSKGCTAMAKGTTQ